MAHPQQRALVALGDMARALFVPDAGAPACVRATRVWAPLLFALGAAAVLGAAAIPRIDPEGEVLARLDRDGRLKEMSEREVTEELDLKTRVGQAGVAAQLALFPPLRLLGLAVAGVLLARLLGGRASFKSSAAAAAAALLPLAAHDLVAAVAALQSSSLVPGDMADLVPLHAGALLPRDAPRALAGFARGADAFALWSAGVFALGLAQAASIPRLRALAGVYLSHACWVSLVRVAGGGGP
jgi:hypothetical protein